MQLNIEQKRIIANKPNGHSLIKGVAGSGKTTVAVNKIPLLLRHYCPLKDDKVLMVTYNKSLKQYVSNIYDKVKDKVNVQVNLFDEDNSLKLYVKRIDDILIDYFNAYKKQNDINIDLASRKECKYELINAINFIGNIYKDVKIIDSKYLQFIKEEIMWIKACNYIDLEEYQLVDRIGRISNINNDGPQKLRKNSEKRRAIFEVLLKYNSNLQNINKVDFQDMALLALNQAKQYPIEKYTHILIDESQDLTRVELEFLKALYDKKPYSSITFISDAAQSIYHQAWLIKNRSFASLGYDMTGKSNLLSKNYRTTAQIAEAAFSLIDIHKDLLQNDNLVKPNLIDKQGDYPTYENFENKFEECIYIVNLINETLKEGYKLKDIVIIARLKKQLKEFRKCLQAYDIPCSIFNDNDEINFSEDEVKLVTMHSVKGLEFKVVIIAGLNAKVMPLCPVKNEEEDMDMLEFRERKLLYVGMTRATEKLFLTSHGMPSKFIRDIDDKYLRMNMDSNMRENCK
ncbi:MULTISPECIES: 3'-5' exonuclease [unclassified Clostridium]|uniref:3'-5' exonuclease n=1 Tax=unclassified Clostridium TaxID=2614128 RepID=UPI0013F726FA|nr:MULTISPECIES: 3'-5' exonuclease [unclassified Clostridium]NFR88093.1 LexA family transcriptional regulator [Clostridium botulinum]NFR90744.1 LexA family transcriptional regulator [Clostridium botulinum]NFU00191.1 LexA family transcriptional regulator [Clostridium botulinum]